MLTRQSKNVCTGDIFVCEPCENAHEHCREAIERGAQKIVGTKDIRALVPPAIEFEESANPRQYFAQHLAILYNHAQPPKCFAVTGTNGKTSVVHFLGQIWTLLGKQNAILSTIGLYKNNIKQDVTLPSLTTQSPELLCEILSSVKDCEYFAFEATSIGIDQHRIDVCRMHAAAFTNLSQDHLDYHGNMDDYFEAKHKLFTDYIKSDQIKVINADCPWGQKLLTLTGCISYGRSKTYDFSYDDDHLYIKGCPVASPLKGRFQIENLLCAAALCESDGLHVRDVIPLIKPIPGRLEEVAPGVFVDFAHTPDALEQLLLSLRPMCRGRIILVFGCGGNRDQTKRARMGRIAQQLADIVLVTDDNPRFEDPALIRRMILSACPNGQEFDSREEAIKHALCIKGKGDIVVIAGKGHESGQTIGDTIHPFSDQAVVRALL